MDINSYRSAARIIALGFLLCSLPLSGGAFADEKNLTVRIVGTSHPSSFNQLIYVHVFNPAYTPADLAGWVSASELIIDGQPSNRTGAFSGPPGLAPKGDWEGCFSADDYTPAIAAGKHRLSLKLGGFQSYAATVKWFNPVDWRQGDMKSRTKEIKDLASAITEGMPQACVEQWLTKLDGGVQQTNRVRYYLDPGFKVVVPYTQAGLPGNKHAVVSGPAQSYQENRIRD
jgi:hypothetical protein